MSNSILNRPFNVTQSKNSAFNPQIIQQFNQFKRTFTGNPQQAVMNLLQQGSMTNEQFQQLSQMAQQFRQLLR